MLNIHELAHSCLAIIVSNPCFDFEWDFYFQDPGVILRGNSLYNIAHCVVNV